MGLGAKGGMWFYYYSDKDIVRLNSGYYYNNSGTQISITTAGAFAVGSGGPKRVTYSILENTTEQDKSLYQMQPIKINGVEDLTWSFAVQINGTRRKDDFGVWLKDLNSNKVFYICTHLSMAYAKVLLESTTDEIPFYTIA